MEYLHWSEHPIEFSRDDHPITVPRPGNAPLVLKAQIGTYDVDAPSWHGSLMVLVRGEWPARWEPQEEGVMSIAAGFPSVKKPRYVDLGEERQTTEGDAC
jgi:hypothetical protein